jgi:hypothetical protein
MYDNTGRRKRILTRLHTSAEAIRTVLSSQGNDQSALGVNRNSLAVKGVIYAIYCFRSMELYIGQTVKSCMDRFAEHVRSARRGDSEPLHKAMRRLGWRNFGCFPLEVISSSQYMRRNKPNAADFKREATPRELFCTLFRSSSE